MAVGTQSGLIVKPPGRKHRPVTHHEDDYDGEGSPDETDANGGEGQDVVMAEATRCTPSVDRMIIETIEAEGHKDEQGVVRASGLMIPGEEQLQIMSNNLRLQNRLWEIEDLVLDIREDPAATEEADDILADVIKRLSLLINKSQVT